MTGQADFTQALLDPKQAVPEGLVDPQGRPAPKRFDVYRNNVAVSLTDALETAFPVIHKLLGDDFFRAMAGVYLRAHPPSSALMMYYGAAMPAFLRSFEPVSHLPYLADVARLEIAIREAYHSADSTPIAPETLGALAPNDLMQARFTLAPALRIVTSDWPIHALWQFNMAGGPKPQMQAQDVMVARPEFDPVQTVLPVGAAMFVTALGQDEPLGTAFERVTQTHSDFDLSATLGCLLGASVLTSLTIGPPT